MSAAPELFSTLTCGCRACLTFMTVNIRPIFGVICLFLCFSADDIFLPFVFNIILNTGEIFLFLLSSFISVVVVKVLHSAI